MDEEENVYEPYCHACRYARMMCEVCGNCKDCGFCTCEAKDQEIGGKP